MWLIRCVFYILVWADGVDGAQSLPDCTALSGSEIPVFGELLGFQLNQDHNEIETNFGQLGTCEYFSCSDDYEYIIDIESQITSHRKYRTFDNEIENIGLAEVSVRCGQSGISNLISQTQQLPKGGYEAKLNEAKQPITIYTSAKSNTAGPTYIQRRNVIGMAVVQGELNTPNEPGRYTSKNTGQVGLLRLYPIYQNVPNVCNNIVVRSGDTQALTFRQLCNSLHVYFGKTYDPILYNEAFFIAGQESGNQATLCPSGYAVKGMAVVFDFKDCSSTERRDCGGITAASMFCAPFKCNPETHYLGSTGFCFPQEACECVNGIALDETQGLCRPGTQDCLTCNDGYYRTWARNTEQNEAKGARCRFQCLPKSDSADYTRSCFGGQKSLITSADPWPGITGQAKIIPAGDGKTCRDLVFQTISEAARKSLAGNVGFAALAKAFKLPATSIRTDLGIPRVFSNYELDVLSTNNNNECDRPNGDSTPSFDQCLACYEGFLSDGVCCREIFGCEVPDDLQPGSPTGTEFCENTGRACFPTQSGFDGDRDRPFYSCNCTCDASSECGESPFVEDTSDVCICNSRYVYDSASRINPFIGPTSRMCFTCLNSLGFEDPFCSGHGTCTPSVLDFVRPQCSCLDGYIGTGCEFEETIDFSCGDLWEVSCSPDPLLEEQFNADPSWLFADSWRCVLTPSPDTQTLGNENKIGISRQGVRFRNVALAQGRGLDTNYRLLDPQELCWSFAYRASLGFTPNAELAFSEQGGLYLGIQEDSLTRNGQFPYSPRNYGMFGIPWTEMTLGKRSSLYTQRSGLITGNRGLCPFPFNEDLSLVGAVVQSNTESLSSSSSSSSSPIFIPCRLPNQESIFIATMPVSNIDSEFATSIIESNGEVNVLNLTELHWKVTCFVLRKDFKHNSVILLRCLRLHAYPLIDCVVSVQNPFISTTPDALIEWDEALDGESCDYHCQKRDSICTPNAFTTVSDFEVFYPSPEIITTLSCNSSIITVTNQQNLTAYDKDLASTVPFRTNGDVCHVPDPIHLQNQKWDFSCAAKRTGQRRLCPCMSSTQIDIQELTLGKLIQNQCTNTIK